MDGFAFHNFLELKNLLRTGSVPNSTGPSERFDFRNIVQFIKKIHKQIDSSAF